MDSRFLLSVSASESQAAFVALHRSPAAYPTCSARNRTGWSFGRTTGSRKSLPAEWHVMCLDLARKMCWILRVCCMLTQTRRYWSRWMLMGTSNRTSARQAAVALALMALLSVPASATDCLQCGGSAPMPEKCHMAPPAPHPCCSDTPTENPDCRHDPDWAIKAAWKPVPHPQNSSRSYLGSGSRGADDWEGLQRTDRERAFSMIGPHRRSGQQSGLHSLVAVLRI